MSAIIVILLTLLHVLYADLPIHCLRSQVIGRWKWQLTRSSKDTHISCGHPSHDSNLDELTNANKYNFIADHHLDLALSYPDHVVNLDNGDTGSFTMVFDEGIEIRISGQVLFAKFKYQIKDSGRDDGYFPPITDLQAYDSFCGETSVGWYHDEANQNWGCVRGHQYQGDQKQLVKSAASSVLVTTTDFFNAESHTTKYQPDLKLITSVNSDPFSLWKAGINEVFLGESLFDISRMLGRRRYHKPVLFRSAKRHDVSGGDTDLPGSVDWRYLDSPIRNQGQCGSCYIFSTLSMLETRARVARPQDKSLTDLHYSEQDVLACSRYNEGCEGGYPYLVAKYAHEFGVNRYGENRYLGYDSACPDGPDSDRTSSSSAYHYVGGYFGACNEVEMMKEVALYGPIVTAIQVPSSLMVYKSGIFNNCPRRVKDDDGYEQSDHAVLVVGYGEENGVKYWIIRNSWGEEYGEEGYFRLLRGVDACGVESAAVTTYV